VFNSEDPIRDYDEKNFAEVDLGEQQVYIFRDGKLAFQCNCISGRPTGKRKTRPGTFFIKEKQYYRVLKGDDYETPVNYWVRISYSGVGFHAAPWQGWGSWSPTYYIYGGSHGCINLSTTNAKTVYELVQSGEAVFMHY
jgi:lipoprotein-anchoring transpeptidase ErfK/SrfK